MNSISIEEYQILKKQIESLKKEESKLEGQIDSILEQLKEVGCSSIKEARRMLERLDKKYTKTEEEFNLAKAEVEEILQNKLEN